MKVTSTDFQQNVGRYQDAAQQAPVAITKNGRTHTVLVVRCVLRDGHEGPGGTARRRP